MDSVKRKAWLGIIASAVALGLSVVCLMQLWRPVDVVGWLLWGIAILVACRSIQRIASLAKQTNTKSEE